MRKHFLARAILVALAVLVAAVASAAAQQQVIRRQGGPSDGRLLLPGMLILFKNDANANEFSVSNRMEFAATVDERYKDFDLKEGDVIMMVDGLPMVTAAQFNEYYEKLAVGTEVALGVRREGEPILTSFLKPDPAELPQMRTMPAGEAGAFTTQGSGKVEMRDGKHYVDGKEVKPGEGTVIQKKEEKAPDKEKPKPPPAL